MNCGRGVESTCKLGSFPEYSCLEAEDIAEALSYGAWRAEEVEGCSQPAVKLLEQPEALKLRPRATPAS